MPIYEVECRGVAREVYMVEAANETEAMENWHTGTLRVSEVSSVEPLSAHLEDS